MQIILDDCYQFGLGLFETIAIENNKPLLLSYHLERLQNSIETFGINQTVSKKQIEDYLIKHDLLHHALKIMVSDKNLLFTIRPNPYTKEQYSQGFSLDYSPVMRNETSILTHHKTMNYGDCILEKRRTKLLGVDELLFLNSRGEICEGTTTNIFFVKSGIIYTPPVSCGLLPGIMRRYIIETYPVVEKVLHLEDISQMEECFVTNSLLGIMKVTSVSNVTFSKNDITHKCITQWQDIKKSNF